MEGSMGRAVRSGLGTVVAVIVSVTLLAGVSWAEDPLFTNWSDLLPGFTSGYDPTAANECKSGKINCVNGVIREMTRRFDDLAAACDHDSLFSLAYLRTTEEYKRAAL